MGVVDEGATGSVFSCRLHGCCKRAWRRSMASMSSDAHYRAPDWFTRNVFNRVVAAQSRYSVSGSRILQVPVARPACHGVRPSTCSASALAATSLPLAATRRGSGTSALSAKATPARPASRALRPRRSPTPIRRRSSGVPRRWKSEVGQFFGVEADSSREELERIAPDHPIFRYDE